MDQDSTLSSTDIRQRILKVSTRLFAQMGFEGTSLRDIAKEAQVNVAMVSYYFGNKEGLYLECISHFAKSKIETEQEILKQPKSPEEFKTRFRQIVENKLRVFAEDRDAHKIIMREMQTQRDVEFYKKFVDQLEPVFRTLQGFFQGAIEVGVVKPQFNAELLTMMLMGILSHPCIAEKAMEMKLGYTLANTEVRDQYVDQICEIFFAGVMV